MKYYSILVEDSSDRNMFPGHCVCTKRDNGNAWWSMVIKPNIISTIVWILIKNAQIDA